MFDSQDPWYLTVIRTQGVLFLRPEKSWRPVVSVTHGDNAHARYEVMLGCDGQNPNLKTPFVLDDVDEKTQLDLKIWHNCKSHRKSRRKRHMVGSAYVTLGELLKRQERPGADVAIHLRCPPPQKRSRRLRGNRQSNAVTLTVRMQPPRMFLPGSCAASSTSATLVASQPPSICGDEDEDYSEDEGSMISIDDESDSYVSEAETPWQSPPDVPNDPSAPGFRRRKRIKPYCINTSDEEDCISCSSSDERPGVPLPIMDVQEDEEFAEPRLLPILPQHTGDNGEAPDGLSLSLIEKLVDRFAPYREMKDPGCDFGLIQRRLMGEWYTVAGALLGVAGLNAAVFGFSSGTVFEIDGLALRSVLFGSIVAAIGLVADIWFLVQFGSADSEKFERLSRDVYSSHFFFCLKCRLPTLCLFLSVCALMFFLLAVAWTAWPTAVLVLCSLAGTFFTLQYLVFGFHRAINLMVWLTQRAWRAVFGRLVEAAGATASAGQEKVEAAGFPVDLREHEHAEDCVPVAVGCDASERRPT